MQNAEIKLTKLLAEIANAIEESRGAMAQPVMKSNPIGMRAHATRIEVLQEVQRMAQRITS